MVNHMKIKQPKICPAIISADFSNLELVCQQLNQSDASLLHIDIMDGQFAPHISFGHKVCESIIRMCQLSTEVHLAVMNPNNIIDDYSALGFSRVILPIERINKQLFKQITERKSDLLFGLALKPNTPLDTLQQYLDHPLLDKITVLATEPCQPELDENVFDRISNLRKLLSNRDRSQITIQIDGGVKLNNIRKFYQNGVDEFVIGSAVFNNKSPIDENIDILKSEAIK